MSRFSLLFAVAATVFISCSGLPSAISSREAKDSLVEASIAKNGAFPRWAVPPPAEWSGKTFAPSYSFPSSLPADDSTWSGIDFRTDPRRYLSAVLAYVLEGNEDIDFDVANNARRVWYHVPWLTTGTYGREGINGLTRERSSRPGELAKSQTIKVQNWAVGFYNPRGGYAIGKVWRNPESPDLNGVSFAEGTVAAKLLFSTADDQMVPTLANAYTRQAHIHVSSACPRSGDSDPNCKRVISVVRLVQLDVAVRDLRSPTGWVYGTFVYNGKSSSASPWERLEPLGLMWGDDAGKNVDLTQTKLLLPVASEQHLGCYGRLNGPVDNPGGSCISCHSRAGYPDLDDFAPDDCKVIPKEKYDYYFKDVVYPGTFDPQKQSASYDYSLQLSSGVANFLKSKNK